MRYTEEQFDQAHEAQIQRSENEAEEKAQKQASRQRVLDAICPGDSFASEEAALATAEEQAPVDPPGVDALAGLIEEGTPVDPFTTPEFVANVKRAARIELARGNNSLAWDKLASDLLADR